MRYTLTCGVNCSSRVYWRTSFVIPARQERLRCNSRGNRSMLRDLLVHRCGVAVQIVNNRSFKCVG